MVYNQAGANELKIFQVVYSQSGGNPSTPRTGALNMKSYQVVCSEAGFNELKIYQVVYIQFGGNPSTPRTGALNMLEKC